MGYDDINSREPILGIGSEGRNNIAGASYLYIASNPAVSYTHLETYAMQKGKCPGPMHPLAGYWKTQATLAQNTIRSS